MPEQFKLKLNKKLSLSRDGKKWYATSVQDWSRDSFSVGIPYHQSRPLVLYRGEEITVRCPGENECYQFKTTVLGRTRDQVPLFVLATPEMVERVQQRRFVRLPVSLPVQYAPADGNQKPSFNESFTVDLSAGGMKLALKEQYQRGTVLLLRFQLEIWGRVEDFEVRGKVVRVEVREQDKKSRVYQAGIEFLDLPNKSQDKIMAYIFAKMAEQKKLI